MDTTAAEIMVREILTVTKDTTIEDAMKLMVNNHITGMPVVDKKGRMIGVLSEFDILSQISKEEVITPESFQKPIKFSKGVDAILENTPLETIIEHFIKAKFRRLPVRNAEGRLTGIITRRDLMKLYYYRSKLV